MPALSYKGRFVEYVEAGLKPKPKKGARIKRQTIRNFRKHQIKKGDILYHYYGMRTKWCRKLGESICKSAQAVRIDRDEVTIYDVLENEDLKFNKAHRTTRALNKFAYADGFTNWEEMRKWWVLTHGPDCFPFTGQLIKWDAMGTTPS